MRYYAQYNDSGNLIAIGTGAGGTEITEAEYNRILAEIREKADLVDKLYLCQRTGEAAGGTVVLQYLPHELVFHYFTEVT